MDVQSMKREVKEKPKLIDLCKGKMVKFMVAYRGSRKCSPHPF
jgi:hypothetical protein